ncbi:MAG: hypothetical protein GWM98_06845 [Nitrospinaceae bacterium]|nr:hypothetical protein [Nitrospinaceae bacterium]NIR54262.1 hypothetical protein [Nitrospinaceae bacterium]NIS84679.1 hypothetical protein [Nitrospinaceae bacterium]NIT81474.1 hypothetical protein [Nitrospinaceae bacterium]NIU43758.1 hypothetical protein [Nitrospinaceae bacterium]
MELGIFNSDQILGAVMFFAGIGLLTWCSNVERKQMIKMRDPKLKWSYIDSEGKKRDEVKKRNLRSTAITIIGGGMALYGFISFLANVK